MLDATRLRHPSLFSKIVTAEEAAQLITDGMTVGVSGFTPSGYPKKTTLALAKAIKSGKKCRINIWSGASVGPEIEEELAKVGGIRSRMPYYAASNKTISNQINDGTVEYIDQHLSHFAQQIDYGFFGEVDVAIVEATAITREGNIILGPGVGNTPMLVKHAKKIIVEVNTSLPLSLEGMDLPTQIGLDSDAPLSFGEVGKVGVAIDSLADMEKLFEGIPLDKVSTSMTINGPAAVLLAMYIAVAEKQGVKPEQLKGTIQNDILKEYIARGTYIFPPRPSMRLITDTFAYCSQNIPKWNTISVGAYHIREAGASEVQEVAFAFANAIAYIDAAINAGQKVDDFAPGISWIFTAGLDFFFEIAKFRAARRLWARIMKERYGASVPKSQMLRVHVHTAGSVLTAQQPLNNVARITWQALSAVLGGIQSMACCAYDEAIALPTEESATLALRTQQLIAYESGATDTIDPIAGSYYVESLTNKIEQEAYEYIRKIDAMGGAVAAIEQGYMQSEMAAHAYEYQQSIENGARTVIGVNKFADDKAVKTNDVIEADLSIAERQIARVNEMKAHRDQNAVDAALANLRVAAQGEANLMPYLIAAVKTYATLGEICGVLREVFGEYAQNGNIF